MSVRWRVRRWCVKLGMCRALPVSVGGVRGCTWRCVECRRCAERRCAGAVRVAAEPLSPGRRRRHKPVPGGNGPGLSLREGTNPPRRRPAPLGARGVAEPGERGGSRSRTGGAPRPLPAGAAPRGLRRSPPRAGAGSASRPPHPASRLPLRSGHGHGHTHTHTPAHTRSLTHAQAMAAGRELASPRDDVKSPGEGGGGRLLFFLTALF